MSASPLTKGVLPFSSYFLWTQKGYTRVPLCRGSCYVLGYELTAGFFTRHIITAGHVAMPIKFQNCFGNAGLLTGLGERHITAKVLLGSSEKEWTRAVAAKKAERDKAREAGSSPSTLLSDEAIENDPSIRIGRVIGDLNCNYKVDVFPTTTVGRLTLKQEDNINLCPPHIRELFTPLTADLNPIQPGEELLYVGYDMVEDKASPHDGYLTMYPITLEGKCVAAIDTRDYGLVVVGSTDAETKTSAMLSHSSAAGKAQGSSSNSCLRAVGVPTSMAGGAVIRKSTGGVVGTIAAKTTLDMPPPIEINSKRSSGSNKIPYRDPCVDIGGFGENLTGVVGEHGIAFTPIAEFHRALRKLE